MSYKIAFFDVDGTLKNTEAKIPASTKESILKLQEKGIHVVIATGRPIYESKEIMDELNVKNIITMNGGQIFINNKILTNKTIDQSSVEKLLKTTEERGESATLLGTNGSHHFNKKHQVFLEFVETFGFKKVREGNLPLNKIGDVQLMTIFCKNKSSIPYFSFLENKLQTVSGRLKEGYHMDFYPNENNKANGVKMVLDELGILKEEAIAFGDGMNDLEMIEYVGMGIAMGNGAQELKEIANFVTKHVDDNGIEFALKHLNIL
jgi:hypothetical protein